LNSILNLDHTSTGTYCKTINSTLRSFMHSPTFFHACRSISLRVRSIVFTLNLRKSTWIVNEVLVQLMREDRLKPKGRMTHRMDVARLGLSRVPNPMLDVVESPFPGVYGTQVCIPEQADHTNEHEPKVWRDDCKVYDLSRYIYGPITQEGRNVCMTDPVGCLAHPISF